MRMIATPMQRQMLSMQLIRQRQTPPIALTKLFPIPIRRSITPLRTADLAANARREKSGREGRSAGQETASPRYENIGATERDLRSEPGAGRYSKYPKHHSEYPKQLEKLSQSCSIAAINAIHNKQPSGIRLMFPGDCFVVIEKKLGGVFGGDFLERFG
jgi:hypothetical protein